MTAAPFRFTDRAARERAEEQLAPSACRAAASRGRARPEAEDPLRTAFERDRDRILHAKAFRRLKHKTQVFLNPDGDHFVTRLTHTLQVTQVARSLARALGLNETLAEAIALAHDVGHSPFGHIGEDAFDPYVPGGWHHAAQGVRIVEVFEHLNLTWEVRDGVRAHSWKITPPPSTREAECVRYADRIGYLSHDALDAVRAGVLRPDELPASSRAVFGEPGSQMVGAMIDAVVAGSRPSRSRPCTSCAPSCSSGCTRRRPQPGRSTSPSTSSGGSSTTTWPTPSCCRSPTATPRPTPSRRWSTTSPG
jgi:dGTPase